MSTRQVTAAGEPGEGDRNHRRAHRHCYHQPEAVAYDKECPRAQKVVDAFRTGADCSDDQIDHRNHDHSDHQQAYALRQLASANMPACWQEILLAFVSKSWWDDVCKLHVPAHWSAGGWHAPPHP